MNTKHLYTSLGLGVTQGSVTDNTIIDSSVIEIYFDNTDCYIDGTSQEGHTVYFTVGGNATGTNVCVVVNNLTDFVPYNDTEVQTHLSLLDTDVNAMSSVVTSHGTEIINLQLNKQDNLTPGDNITIEDNVISATKDSIVYDDNEHVLGSYFGKKLYSKLIKINALPSTATTQSYPHNIANIGHIVSFQSFHHFAGESVANGTNLSFSGTTMYASGCFNVTVDRNNINIAVGQNRSNVSCEVIINYTKVGD